MKKDEGLGLFSCGEKNARKGPHQRISVLKGGYKEDGGSQFIKSYMEKTSSNRYKLHRESFYLDIKKKNLE